MSMLAQEMFWRATTGVVVLSLVLVMFVRASWPYLLIMGAIVMMGLNPSSSSSENNSTSNSSNSAAGLSESRFFQSCVGHSTAAACSCILNGGGCACLVKSFHSDPEWEAYRTLKVRAATHGTAEPSPARLLHSYAPSRCVFSSEECTAPACVSGLAAVEQEIQNGGAVSGLLPAPEVVPGSKIDLAGPLPFELARGLAVTGISLGVALLAFRAFAPVPGARDAVSGTSG